MHPNLNTMIIIGTSHESNHHTHIEGVRRADGGFTAHWLTVRYTRPNARRPQSIQFRAEEVSGRFVACEFNTLGSSDAADYDLASEICDWLNAA